MYLLGRTQSHHGQTVRPATGKEVPELIFGFLNKHGLPVKYAIMGLLGGILWLIIAALINYETQHQIATLISLTVGGAIGGYIRQRMGKTS